MTNDAIIAAAAGLPFLAAALLAAGFFAWDYFFGLRAVRRESARCNRRMEELHRPNPAYEELPDGAFVVFRLTEVANADPCRPWQDRDLDDAILRRVLGDA